ncbi:hypothetical protein CVS40_11703 [Lucilia cuprina]|nr:hypothetical protein CVS40_11703 [Lucilia cuprina]
MIKKNLRENIGRIVYPMAVSSVEELRMSCLDAEKTFLKRDFRQQPSVPVGTCYQRQINELYKDQETQPVREETFDEVAAVRLVNASNSTPRQTLVCWNCRQNGHMFMDCPAEERSIFCYRCGKPDVIAPNCVNCRNRNFPRNEGRAGDHRSSHNPQ